MTTSANRDHGGRIAAAAHHYGGALADWIDLSTGINPVPYPLPDIPLSLWHQLPDQDLFSAFDAVARALWQVPPDAQIVVANGASALIAALPSILTGKTVEIPQPTYNEHQAAFQASGWSLGSQADVKTIVHPNNPTGHWYSPADLTAPICIIDESFCDIAPEKSILPHAVSQGHIVLKSFGKFWGLAGARLGCAIMRGDLAERLTNRIGPWAVSGPTLAIATRALADHDWAQATRARLKTDAARLDALMISAGATVAGGTDLFRLYDVDDAAKWQDRLCQSHILTRIFPYSKTYLRMGIPAPHHWPRLQAALCHP